MANTPVTKRPLIAMIHALRLHEGRARHPGGNFHHVHGLLRAMLPMAEARGWQLRVLVDEDGKRDLGSLLSDEQLCYIGGRHGIIADDFFVAAKVAELQPEIYYRPTGQLPFVPLNCTELMGVADLNFRWLKTPIIKRVYKELSYSWSFLRACRVVCISAFTRDDVMLRFSLPRGRLHVISHGANRVPVGQRPSWAPDPGQFWMTFGHQAHKNVEMAFRAISENRLPAFRDTLVVIGQSEYVDFTLKPLSIELGISKRVVFPGKIPAEHLGWLYRNAIGLLFVSRFEGFGLPILEAMHHGCPVIGSSIPPLREVGGMAMDFVEIGDHIQLARTMCKYVSAPDVRAARSRAGLERAAEFTWERAAIATYDLWDAHVQSAGDPVV